MLKNTSCEKDLSISSWQSLFVIFRHLRIKYLYFSNEIFIASHVRTYSWSWVIPLTGPNSRLSPNFWHHICCHVRYWDLGMGIWWNTKNGRTLFSTNLLIKVGLRHHNVYKMPPHNKIGLCSPSSDTIILSSIVFKTREGLRDHYKRKRTSTFKSWSFYISIFVLTLEITLCASCNL